MDDLSWSDLAAPGRVGERSQLTNEDFERALATGVSDLEDIIADLRWCLLVRGLAVTDLYFKMSRENAFSKEETLLVPRIRMDERYGTPSFYWERTIRHAYPLTSRGKMQPNKGKGRSYEAYVRCKGAVKKEKMRVVLLSKHVPINKTTLSVSMKEFDKEPEWARMAAQLVEPELVELRRQAKALSAVSRAVKNFSRLVKREDGSHEH